MFSHVNRRFVFPDRRSVPGLLSWARAYSKLAKLQNLPKFATMARTVLAPDHVHAQLLAAVRDGSLTAFAVSEDGQFACELTSTAWENTEPFGGSIRMAISGRLVESDDWPWTTDLEADLVGRDLFVLNSQLEVMLSAGATSRADLMRYTKEVIARHRELHPNQRMTIREFLQTIKSRLSTRV